MLSADYICKQFGPRPGPTKWKMLSVGPDLDPSCLTLIVFLKQFFKKSDFEKKSADDRKHAKFPVLFVFCCISSQVNSYGHRGTVSSPLTTLFPGQA